MAKVTVKELKSFEKELVNEVLTDIKKMDLVMSQYQEFNEELKTAGFRHYSLRNLILANGQLYQRKQQTIEILAPFNRWGKINRHVCKGEKALWILAPIQKKIKEATETDEAEYRTWFKRVPVFDLSQTDGEEILSDWTNGKSTKTFDEIVAKCGYPVELNNMTLEKGSTDGETIWVSDRYGDERKICILFHELGHAKLHFGEDRPNLKPEIKELEAETISYMCSKALGVTNEEAGAYISNWYKNNPKEEIVKRSAKLIKTAQEILNSILNDLDGRKPFSN